MYTKLFSSLFDGSLYGRLEAVTVFMCLLAHADQHGEVDLSPQRIAGCLGADMDFVERGLKELLAPDPMSRTPAEEGRRIVPLLNDEGAPRAFGWRLVNYGKYRCITSEIERREYKRNWDRDNRSSRTRQNPTPSDKSDTARRAATQGEGEGKGEERKPNPHAPDAARRPPLKVVKVNGNRTTFCYRITFDFEAKAFQGITEADELRWQEAYPAVPIPPEIAKAAAWLVANPANRKRNYERFLVNWFSRAQDRAPRVAR